MTPKEAKPIPSMLTPAARRERAQRLVIEGVLELVRATIDEGNTIGEWIDQDHSPLGREKHKRLCQKGVLPSRKHGKKILVKRDDLNAYIERAGLSRGRRIEEEDVVDIVERITTGGRR